VEEFQPSGSATLVIISHLRSPEELAEAVGMEPDRSWRKGDIRGPRSRGPHKASGVEYHSGLSGDLQPQEHLRGLLARLEPYRDQIASLAEALSEESGAGEVLRVWFSHTTAGDITGYDFSPDQLRAISDLGAHLGVSVWLAAAG
jgi:hypothetical protein